MPLNGDGITVYPTTGTITVTDGISIATVGLTNITPELPVTATADWEAGILRDARFHFRSPGFHVPR